ncbi:hypothetical protein [Nonomuraea sp. LPB2021202275-12-8]|uniref:hypothetical protein n=1 Tax=Nonomuraea sp. LPB2021202275-12-8 TaxID=3120159 RepID=UPI00300C92DF
MTTLHTRLGAGLWLIPAAPRPHVSRVLRLTGLDRRFPYGITPGAETGSGGRVGSGPAAAR